MSRPYLTTKLRNKSVAIIIIFFLITLMCFVYHLIISLEYPDWIFCDILFLIFHYSPFQWRLSDVIWLYQSAAIVEIYSLCFIKRPLSNLHIWPNQTILLFYIDRGTLRYDQMSQYIYLRSDLTENIWDHISAKKNVKCSKVFFVCVVHNIYF